MAKSKLPKWTAEKETRLQNLLAEKEAIGSAEKQVLSALIHDNLEGYDTADMTPAMIETADLFVNALTPFCTYNHIIDVGDDV